jgi:hypothetical protein
MTATAESPEDRIALEKLVTEYANAIDRREWHRLDQVFLPDSRIDYRATGGIEAPYDEMKDWLVKSLRFFKSYMHLMGNFHFEVQGDQARGQVACFNPMVIPRLIGGGPHTIVFGIWYHDEYRRTAQGWRIVSRRQQLCYAFNLPIWMRIARYAYARLNARRRRVAVA